jgi:hypothetical protein
MLKATCKHCKKEIVHYQGNMWLDDGFLVPQYCMIDPIGHSQLHEPEGIVELINDKKD